MKTSAIEIWNRPPKTPALSKEDVHIWRIDLGDEPAKHRAISRSGLRAILGRYLNCNPADIRFEYGAKGKPALAGEHGVEAIHFNLSHSGSICLYAFTRAGRIGIDIEWMGRRMTDMWAVAKRFFSPAEYAAIAALPPEQKSRGFFNCWTRKEAFIKARGDGLSMPLDRFVVTLAPGEPARLVRVEDDPPEIERWTLKELEPAEGYAGAVAVEGRPMSETSAPGAAETLIRDCLLSFWDGA